MRENDFYASPFQKYRSVYTLSSISILNTLFALSMNCTLTYMLVYAHLYLLVFHADTRGRDGICTFGGIAAEMVGTCGQISSQLRQS